MYIHIQHYLSSVDIIHVTTYIYTYLTQHNTLLTLHVGGELVEEVVYDLRREYAHLKVVRHFLLYMVYDI